MNYKIINNEDKLKEFIEWLPILQDDEVFYVSLFSRMKYCKGKRQSNKGTQIKRFACKKEFLLNKIKQLEVVVGNYSIDGKPIPQESLALYIHPNPRSLRKATFMLMKESLKMIQEDNAYFNIQAKLLSAIQKSKNRNFVVDFDIDSKDIDFRQLEAILAKNAYDVIETRGGYHVLVYPKITLFVNWYNKIREQYDVDNTGDMLLPVVGCCQGGFTPRFTTK